MCCLRFRRDDLIVRTFKQAKLPKSNISKGERVALQTLKKDNSIIILPADKGRAMVIMNTAEYREKMTNMVGDTNTYTRLSKDPTHKYKNRMINILRKWKRNGSISDKLYWKLYPESEEPPKLYGTPKIHKNNTPLRPVVSSCGSITYNAAKYLASILTPLVGKNCHSIKNTKELVDKLRDLEIPPARKLVSYDVTALFTSVPVDKALEVITERLHADDTLTSRTEMTIPQIVELLDFCLNTTYFIYDGTYYQQTHGATMGSPISPLVANCYLEQFEKVAISTAPHPHHCGYNTWMTHLPYSTNTTWKSSLNT